MQEGGALAGGGRAGDVQVPCTLCMRESPRARRGAPRTPGPRREVPGEHPRLSGGTQAGGPLGTPRGGLPITPFHRREKRGLVWRGGPWVRSLPAPPTPATSLPLCSALDGAPGSRVLPPCDDNRPLQLSPPA